jgi:hypothetical protein
MLFEKTIEKLLLHREIQKLMQYNSEEPFFFELLK